MDVFDARLRFPSSLIISGPSGSGKTVFMSMFLENLNNILDKEIHEIFWINGSLDKPSELNLKLTKKIVFMQNIPQDLMEYFDKSKNTLLILDDVQDDAYKSKELAQVFSKYSHHSRIFPCLLVQNMLTGVGPRKQDINRNVHYLVLFKNMLDNTIPYILAKRIMPRNFKTFLDIFEFATQKPHSYLFVDGHQETHSNARFRTDIFSPVQKVFIPNKTS